MPPINPSPPRILVLDDDVVMRDLLQALLSLEGFAVHLADSGEQGLEMLRGDAVFDVVLTDLQMPGLSGAALARSLREAMPPEAILVGMSANQVAADTESVFDAFLSKPFDMQLLGDTLERGKRERGARRRAAAGSPEPGREALSATADGAEGVLHPEIFDSLRKLIPAAKLSELFNLTLDDVHRRHARMEAAAAAGDLPAVQREAHAVKGSCGMVGAAELQSLAAAVEGGTTLNTAALAEIPSACRRLRRMLESKLQDPLSSD